MKCHSHQRTRIPGRLPMRASRRGFTLIELLIVVVIIGILAAIAVPKFQSTKGKAYYAGMRSDLHNLLTAQEGYFYDHTTYTCLLYTSPSPRDRQKSRMPSSA